MDKFRKNQRHSRSSVDGMLPIQRSSSPFARLNGTERAPNPLVTSGGSPSQLDNFSSREGFNPSTQNLIRGSERINVRQPKRDASGIIDLSLPPAAAKPTKHRSWKRKTFRSFAGVSIILILVGGFLFGKGYLKLGGILKGGSEGAIALQDNVDPSRLRGEGDGRVNILLLGKGGDGHTAPDLTDTLLIASIDPVQKKAALLSVPRDLYTPKTSNLKINSVYAEAKYAALAKKSSKDDAEKAGFAAIEKQVQDYMGIPIQYHIMVDFAGYEKAINTVGGIDINVDANGTVYEQLWNERTRKNYILDVKQGNQHFDGQRALFYARSRYTSPRGDFDRTERQRKLLFALKDKVLSAGTFANPIKLSQLIDDFGDHIQANMTKEEVLRLYEIGKDITPSDVTSVGLADAPNNYVITGNVNGNSIVRPTAGLTDFTQIQNYVRNALKDGFIAKENATVSILNGTSTPGLATAKSIELKSFGYNVTTVADAPTKTYTKTILVNLRGDKNKYTKNYLEKRLGVTAVSSLPDANIPNPTNSDFVIILGQ